jgi:thiol:disulfide interchange protein
MRIAKRLLLALVIILLIAAAYYGVTLRSIHTYQIEYVTLPKSDAEFQTWLSTQSGIRDARVERNERTILIQFTTPWWQSANAVDVMGHAEANGYKERRSFTFDRHPRW